MITRFIDRYDERRARSGEEHKVITPFTVDAHLLDLDALHDASIQDLARIATPERVFRFTPREDLDVERNGDMISFESSVQTDVAENNRVIARITKRKDTKRAVLVLHQWNASKFNNGLAKILAASGVAVVEMALPYHMNRSRPGALYADHMLSANIGRTLQSFRQAVSDARELVHWLYREGYEEVGLIGMSLGSWVAGITTAHEPSVKRLSLLLTGGSLADMVWDGRATRSLRKSLNGEITHQELRDAWVALDQVSYTSALTRAALRIQMIQAVRDVVVKPDVTLPLLQSLKVHGSTPQIINLGCGHYSVKLLPFNLRTALVLRAHFA